MFDKDSLVHLSALHIQTIHDFLLRTEPGLAGVRPGMSVDALEGRIHHNINYNTFSSIEEVAALYVEVIARGHVFNDGNKRTAFTCMNAFLAINSLHLHADPDDATNTMVEIAEGRMNHKAIAMWLKGKVR